MILLALLDMKEIGMEFPGVKALDGVSLTLRKGEVLALLGENGAGKSTLMKILSGVYPYPSYSGEFYIDGRPCRFNGTRAAAEVGVAIIHQELNLVPGLTVAENIWLGREPLALPWLGVVNVREMERRSAGVLARMQADISPSAMVADLSVGQQQLVEIAKALTFDARILIMDEPTSALAQGEVSRLFDLIRTLKKQGVAIVYISHKLDEIYAVADRVTVLRDGRYVGTRDTAGVTRDELVAMMVGRELNELYPKAPARTGEVTLEVENLSAGRPGRPSEWALRDISFQVRAGEILGIAGLLGSGRTEIATALFGAWEGPVTGRVIIRGQEGIPRSPGEAIARGLALVTEDRKLSGLVLGMTSGENISLASLKALSRWGVVNSRSEASLVDRFIRELRIKVAGPQQAVGTLSGGNQQKVVVAKWLATAPRVLVLDEPTRGIDVGAKAEIYQLMNDLAARGVAILMISSELPEVLAMSDRVLVMHQGRVAGVLTRAEATQERIMSCATGGR